MVLISHLFMLDCIKIMHSALRDKCSKPQNYRAIEVVLVVKLINFTHCAAYE